MNDTSQTCDLGELPKELSAIYDTEGAGKYIFYLRLHGTDLAAHIDDVVWDSISFGSSPTRLGRMFRLFCGLSKRMRRTRCGI